MDNGTAPVAGIKDHAGEDEFDVLWGTPAIAAFIRRTPSQTAYLIKQGRLNGAIRKLGHKTITASKRKLRALICD